MSEKDSEEARFSTLTSGEPPRNQQYISPGADNGSVPIASNNNNTATLYRDIKFVQDLIERCLQLYMNKDEVAKTLFEQARIQADFTNIVWSRLEQENAEFFKVYYTKLILKKQIVMFNELLEKQHHLMNYTAPLEDPMLEGIRHVQANNLHDGYTLPQQHPIPSTVHTQQNLHNGYTLPQQHLIPSTVHGHNDSTGTFSNCDLVYESPECRNFSSTQMNYGGWIPLDNNVVDTAPTQPLTKSENPSPVSVASHYQFPREISESVGSSGFDFAESK